jgi:hypothetical protein
MIRRSIEFQAALDSAALRRRNQQRQRLAAAGAFLE